MEMREAIRSALVDLTDSNDNKEIANVVVVYQYEDRHSRTVAINNNLASAVSLLGHLEIVSAQLRHMILKAEHELVKQNDAQNPEKALVQIARDIVH